MARRRSTSRRLRLVGQVDDGLVTKVGSPADVASMIPYLLGFQPRDSIVVIAIEGPRKRFGPVLRVDLVEPALVRELAAGVVDIIATNGVARVVVAAFADDRRADPAVACLLDRLAERGVFVEDAFRADGQRWWSYLCADPDCCSSAGTPYEPGTSRVAAEAVLSGLSFAPDRDSLRALFSPAPIERRRAVEREVARLRTTDPAPSGGATPHRLADRVVALLDRAPKLTAGDVAWLALAAQSLRGRESALALIGRDEARRHLELWREVMRGVPDDLLPPVGCLAGFAAWLDGNGVLAAHAVDRVVAVAPAYPMATELHELLVRAVNPRTWSGQWVWQDEDERPPPAC